MQIVFSKKTKIQELRTESSHGKGCLTQGSLLRTYIYSAKKQEGNIKHLKIQNSKLHCEFDLAIFWWAGLSDPRTQHEVTEWDEDVTSLHLTQLQFLPDHDHLLMSSGPQVLAPATAGAALKRLERRGD